VADHLTTRRATRWRVTPDPVTDILGVLTICVYGSWYYGYGVIIDDVGEELGLGAAALGAAFGVAQLFVGVLSTVAGRLLDRYGPHMVLGVIGPIGAITLGFAGRAGHGWLFVALFAIGGGVTGATGFYHLTQAVLVRLSSPASATDGDPALRRIIRLTIWGALASPIAIPLTEAIRHVAGWRLAIELPAGAAAVAFLVSSRVIRRVPRAEPTPVLPLRDVIARAVHDPVLIRFIAAAFLSMAAVSTLLVFQVSIMRWAGLSAAAAAGFAGARGLFQLMGRLPLRRALDHVGSWHLLGGARVMVAVACVMLLISGTAWPAVAYVVLAGTSIGALSALDGIVARDVVDTGDIGTMMGVISLAAAAGAAVAPVLAGQLTDATGAPVAAACTAAGCALASAMVLAGAYRRRTRAATAATGTVPE